jgi:hypothetical protein
VSRARTSVVADKGIDWPSRVHATPPSLGILTNRCAEDLTVVVASTSTGFTHSAEGRRLLPVS